MSHLSRTLVVASAFAAATLVGTGAAQAQEPDTHNAVYFTFSQPITLPNLTLPAGKYLFQVTSGPAARDVVVVYSGDKSKALGFLATVPIHRDTPPDKPEVRFMEAGPGVAAPVQSYFFPGNKVGWEFIYPRQQALQIAKGVKEPVLTTAKETPPAEAKGADLALVTSSGQQTAYNENAPAPALAPVAQQGEVAPAAATARAQNQPAATGQQARAETPRTKLPTTASTTPLVALAGLLTLSLGLALGFWRRRLV
jgi:LPXTG-motif cell wall-anchored protein